MIQRIVLSVCLLVTLVASAAVGHAYFRFTPPVKRIQGKVVGWGLVNPGVTINLYSHEEGAEAQNQSFEPTRELPPIATELTGEKGQFRFHNLPKGYYRAEFRKEGWDGITVFFQVDPSARNREVCVRLRISNLSAGSSVETCPN